MAKKGSVVKVRMESEAGTGYRYYKRKNPKNMTEKMRMKRYDPWAVDEKTGKRGMHVWFAEKKMPPHKKN